MGGGWYLQLGPSAHVDVPNLIFFRTLISQDIAARHGVTSMPTFLFFKGKVKVDEMTGADPKKLREKIIKWIGESDSDVGVKGHVSYMMISIVI